MIKKVQKGFTLIELMIVVAIIGILAAIAIPAYSDYTVRAKVAEIISFASAAKTSISEYYLSENAFPNSLAQAGLGTAASIAALSDNIRTVAYATSGEIQFTVADTIGGNAGTKVLAFTPTGSAQGVTWSCSGANTTLQTKYRPANCR